MKLINVIYDDEYNDCDMVLAQDAFCNDILANESFFLNVWATDSRNGCYRVVDGVTQLYVGTADFIRYLNEVFGETESERAKLVKGNAVYNPELPIVMM